VIRRHQIGGHSFQFEGLIELLAKASPARSGDVLAGCAADSDVERMAARWVLADVELSRFLAEHVVDPSDDDVSRLIAESHDSATFAPIADLTVGGLREWLLETAALPDGADILTRVSSGLTPEMVAAVSKIMSNADLVTVARATRVVTAFRSTIGLPGHMATRLQPNHPTDDLHGVAASMLDGLLHGCGDAVIGINPATDDPDAAADLLRMIDRVREHYEIPTQSCVLTHVTTTLELIDRGEPVDLVFQSIAGTEGANRSFGVTLPMLAEAHAAASELRRGTVGSNVMYFETGQGSALSADAYRGVGGKPVDQQTLEARAYSVARAFSPLLVNTVVGFIGPEYLYGGREIIRAGLEDHFCGKLLGLPMGVDVCYTNHADANADDITTLLTLLGAAACPFVITVPGGDDIMLGYQSASFHDAHYIRKVLGLAPAPEFQRWLHNTGIADTLHEPLQVNSAETALRQLVSHV
jgi:ethanolamine ammonia-lyase large subunit